jgi:hypothetical protein
MIRNIQCIKVTVSQCMHISQTLNVTYLLKLEADVVYIRAKYAKSRTWPREATFVHLYSSIPALHLEVGKTSLLTQCHLSMWWNLGSLCHEGEACILLFLHVSLTLQLSYNNQDSQQREDIMHTNRNTNGGTRHGAPDYHPTINGSVPSYRHIAPTSWSSWSQNHNTPPTQGGRTIVAQLGQLRYFDSRVYYEICRVVDCLCRCQDHDSHGLVDRASRDMTWRQMMHRIFDHYVRFRMNSNKLHTRLFVILDWLSTWRKRIVSSGEQCAEVNLLRSAHSQFR